MKFHFRIVWWCLALFAGLSLLHLPLLRLPYYWDEAGYYVPAALDFSQAGRMIPQITLPVGHTPLVMVYLGLVWRVLGFSPLVTRLAITLLAAMTVAALYFLGRRVAHREIAAWSAVLLALSPIFFAQTTLAHLDLAAALFTTLGVYFLLENELWPFALAASLAVLSKETAVVLLPFAWLFVWWRRRGASTLPPAPRPAWIALAVPLAPLAAWTLFYHHATGFWTGNSEYLTYNLYSTLSPARVFWSLLRRVFELFLGSFNWVLTASVLVGFWWGRKGETRNSGPLWHPFIFLTAGLMAIYLVLLSVVGGAILPRYLLPIFPVLYLAAVAMVMRLPRLPARLICGLAAACFAWGWFVNPPYPFPYEDNLAYADFIRLHQQAAKYLESQQGQPRILTAWPSTDELTRPFLGYVREPLRVIPVRGFSPQDFSDVGSGSFDLLYFYSRKWELPGNWATRFPGWLRMQGRYFDYHLQISAEELAARYHLKLAARFERRGQWVEIYSH